MNNKWKYIWGAVSVIVIVLCVYMVTIANASTFPIVPSPVCDNGQHEGNPHCVSPTATPTPTKKPTATPTPTEKQCWGWIDEKWVNVCVTPTPTPKCGWNEDHPCTTPSPTVTPTPTQGCGDDEDCTTPTPTATPSATPTPTNTPSTGNSNSSGGGSGQSNSAPGPAVCDIPFQAPILQGFTADGNGSVTFSWWPSPNVSKYSITYGYSTDNLMYGEDNIPSSSTSITLNGLIPGKNVWAQIQAWQGGCEESSNLFDPIVR